jgi:hypothetical protein
MKSLRIFSLVTLFLAMASFCFAQQKTETLKVSGECGMCKKKIEKAAKEAGASYALWNKDTKILTVKYSSSSTNSAKIQTKIAAVGYDTPDVKATDEAYNKLDQCCQYEREASGNGTAATDPGKSCCNQDGVAATGTNASSKKNGKTAMNCSDTKSCCKDGDKSCCKKKQQ